MPNVSSMTEEVPPPASAMIESMRAYGYSTPMGIADLIDNSIFIGEKNPIYIVLVGDNHYKALFPKNHK